MNRAEVGMRYGYKPLVLLVERKLAVAFLMPLPSHRELSLYIFLGLHSFLVAKLAIIFRCPYLRHHVAGNGRSR